MDTADILRSCKVIAVVGCSKDPEKYSNIVARFLQDAGYRIVPVNPTADEILGEKCYHSLLDIPEKVDMVDVFRPSTEAMGIAEQAVKIRAMALWLQEGIVNEDAKKYAESRGMAFIQDRCTMKEYVKMQG